MQKKLIAVAVAGALAAPLALAQSNVTISGQMKVHWDDVSAGGCAATGCTNLTSRSRMTDNNSWLRFSGEEALGGGTSAWFQIESAIGTTDNVGTTGSGAAGVANSTTIGTRNTAVGLKGGWGTALMGKWDVYYHTIAPVGGDGLANGLTMAASPLDIFFSNGQGNTFGGRFNNVIAYVTPNWNGLSAVIGYTTSPSNETTTPNLQGKDRGWTFNPTYNNGPWSAFYAYLAGNNIGALAAPAPGASGVDVRGNRVGVAYTFPMGVKVGLAWDKNKVSVSDGTASLAGLGVASVGVVAAHSYRERSAWALPVSYTTGPHYIGFAYVKANDLNTSVGNLTQSGAKMWELSYSYALSKRTNINASWVQVNNDGNGRYDFWHPSQAIGAQSAVGLPNGADPRMLAIGMQHSF